MSEEQKPTNCLKCTSALITYPMKNGVKTGKRVRCRGTDEAYMKGSIVVRLYTRKVDPAPFCPWPWKQLERGDY